MEKLRKYLDKNGIQQKDFADALGVHPSTVTRLLDGSICDPKVSLAIEIQKVTKGAVKCADWV